MAQTGGAHGARVGVCGLDFIVTNAVLRFVILVFAFVVGMHPIRFLVLATQPTGLRPLQFADYGRVSASCRSNGKPNLATMILDFVFGWFCYV